MLESNPDRVRSFFQISGSTMPLKTSKGRIYKMSGSNRPAVSSADKYRPMLVSTCSRRRLFLLAVKLRSRLLTALNFLPSMATIASENRSGWRHNSTNWLQTLRIALAFSLPAWMQVRGVSRSGSFTETDNRFKVWR
jgi:hypothetical protein